MQVQESGLAFWKSMRISAWFFAALSTLSLLSPPGATHDEWYHAASIWCGRGINPPHCEEIGFIPEYGMSAVVNLVAINCKAEPTEPLNCPAGRQTQSRPLINDGLYPPVFYWILSWFVVPSVDASFLLVRSASALMLSLLLGLCLWMLPSRYRLVLSFVVLTAFSSTGLFLFSSMNPSSWSSFGIGIGWLPLFAAFASRSLGFNRRLGLGTVGILSFLIAIGSRWDSIPMISGVIVIGAIFLGWELRPQWRRKLLMLAVTAPIGLFILLEQLSPFSPLHHLRTLYTYSKGQPDNLLFFSYNLNQALPNVLRALGTVPALSLIVIPKAVYIVGLLLLIYTMSRVRGTSMGWQTTGLLAVTILMAILIMTQVATNDYRDLGSVEPRYVYPLFLFGVGWWYSLGSDESLIKASRNLMQITFVAIGIYFVFVFSIAERFVDQQSYGLRLIPEGPDQWWWQWMPFGPNVVVGLSTLCISMFLLNLVSLARRDESMSQ